MGQMISIKRQLMRLFSPEAGRRPPGVQDPKAEPSIHQITVFGDSHSSFFFPTAAFYGMRCGLTLPLRLQVVGKAIPAASVAGFRPGVSTLQVKETITEGIGTATHMALAFGQVDLELGYYYRLAVKKESLTPDSYVAWLIDIYAAFLRSLDLSSCRVVLKGANLTALTPKPFATRYVSQIVTQEGDLSQRDIEALVAPFILSEDGQNDMHLQFNRKLSHLAKELGFGYFDLNDALSEGLAGGTPTSVPRLAEHMKTARFDHHLADTVLVRRLHYEALGKAFSFA